MRKLDNFEAKMSKFGKVKPIDPVGFHPIYGELKHGQVVELPDDWDFVNEPLFEEVEQEQPKRTTRKKSED